MKDVVAVKNFNGFIAEILPNEDRPGVNCFISKGSHSSSLAVAEDYGFIECDYGYREPMKITEFTLSRIRAWAESYGY